MAPMKHMYSVAWRDIFVCLAKVGHVLNMRDKFSALVEWLLTSVCVPRVYLYSHAPVSCMHRPKFRTHLLYKLIKCSSGQSPTNCIYACPGDH